MKSVGKYFANDPGLTLILVSGTFSLILIYAITYISGFDWLALLVLLVPVVSWLVVKSYHSPHYLIAMTAFGTYMGSVIFLAEGATVPITLFQLFLFFSFFVVFIRRTSNKQFVFRLSGIETELLLFLTLIFFSILYTPAPQDGLIYAIRILFVVAFFVLVLNEINHENEISFILLVICLTCAVLAIISIRTTMLNPEIVIENVVSEGRKLRGRATGTSHDPNRFATFFFIPIAFTVSILISKLDLWKRGISFGALLILIPGILITYSRSAWISVMIMLVIIAVMFRQYRIFLYLAISGIIAMILLPDIRMQLMTIVQRFLDIIAGVSDESSRARLLLGIAAVSMFIDSWMIGVGIKGFVDNFYNYYTYQESLGIAEPHNVIYTVLAELGIIGLILYLFIFGKIIVVAHKNIKSSMSDMQLIINITLFSSIIAFMVFYQFYGGALNDNNIWMLAGMIFFMKYRQGTIKNGRIENSFSS